MFEPLADDPGAGLFARQSQTLSDLAAVGLALAGAIRVDGPGDAGLAFERIARAVRQTVALEARLAEDRRAAVIDIKAREAGRRACAAALDAKAATDRESERVATVSRLVERAIRTETSADTEQLLQDLGDTLEDVSADLDFADRPIAEIVARICRDLGISPPKDFWAGAFTAAGAAPADPGEAAEPPDVPEPPDAPDMPEFETMHWPDLGQDRPPAQHLDRWPGFRASG